MDLATERVAAVLVTRGNVDLTPLLASPPFQQAGEIVVWDNSKRADHGVYGRYTALDLTSRTVAYVQDDDIIVDEATWKRLLASYEPGVLAAVMPMAFRKRYKDMALLGFGAVFDKDLAQEAFARFAETIYSRHVNLSTQRRCSDVIFACMTPTIFVAGEPEILPYAYGNDRMFKQPNHTKERLRVYRAAKAAANGR